MSDGSLQGLRLLLLEDELVVLMLVEDMLAELGCTIIGPATRLADALRLVAEERIDVALLDVDLGPGEHGYPVAEALARRGVPFAFVTGYDADSLPPDWRGRPTLQKPFQMATLRRAVGALAASLPHRAS